MGSETDLGSLYNVPTISMQTMTQKQVDGLESDATKRIEAINFLLSTVCVSICLPAAIGRKDAEN